VDIEQKQLDEASKNLDQELAKLNLRAAALESLQAEKAYTSTFRLYFKEVVEDLDPIRWMHILGEFKATLLEYRDEGRSLIEKACKEFFRKAATGEGNYDVDEAIRFAKSWSSRKKELHQIIGPAHFGRGDDSHGDFVDAAVLLGLDVRRVVKDACEKHVDDRMVPIDDYINEYIDDNYSDSQREFFKNLVLHGENYFAMLLEDAAQDRFKFEARK